MRRFSQHRLREEISLNDGWVFTFHDKKIINITTDIPWVWESSKEFVNYRGVVFAKKEFKLVKKQTIRLVFKGVSHSAKVYMDGNVIGYHYNAYTPFNIVIPDLEEGIHTISMEINNQFDETSSLHIPNDYYTYGGINRPVGLQLLNSDIYIKQQHLTTKKIKNRWIVKSTVIVENLGESRVGSISLKIMDKYQTSTKKIMDRGLNIIEIVNEYSDVKEWSPSDPNLYLAESILYLNDIKVDDLIERIGFREIEICGEKILLNGSEIYLLGINRHEDHPITGCALTQEQMLKDMAIIKDLNCNAVRTSHYPNDERFLDLCDEEGIMVWEESHARGLSIEDMKHRKFEEQCYNCNLEMITEHYNHPSIIIWGLLNECASGNSEGAIIYQNQINQLRFIDKSRPITFASCAHGTDQCQNMIDICSWNIYSMWYNDTEPLDDLKLLQKSMDHVGLEGKPLIISEFGAGALPGYKDPIRRAKWSEERQATILEKTLLEYKNSKRVTGLFIWQFCDTRVTDEKFGVMRPRTMNNKGLVSEYREEKLSYQIVKKIYKHFFD